MEFFVGLLYPFAVTYIVLFVVDYVLRASTDALLQGDLSNAFNPIFDLAIVAGSVSFIVYKIRKLGPMVKMNRFTAFFIGELMGTVLSLALLWFTSGIL